MAWDPEQYRRFEAERNRPVADLLHALGALRGMTVVDAGCGPGNSTEALLRHFPDAAISAFDSDPNMVEAARRRLPRIEIRQADVERWSPPAPVDLIFSNAVFHWVPDHLPVLSRLSDRLTPGGALALQMPDNLGEPTHLLMEETARHGPWSPLFASGLPHRHPLPTPAAYMETLGAAGLEVTLWRTTYFHQLPDADAIVDFVGGAGLRPWIGHVEREGGAAMADAYKQAYRKAVEAAYPPMADGSVLMAMPRLFLVARKRTATGESPAEAGL